MTNSIEEIRSIVAAAPPPAQAAASSVLERQEMLDCLNQLGKVMIASSVQVSMVKERLEEVAAAYGYASQVVALPNLLLIKLGEGESFKLDVSIHTPSVLNLDQASEVGVVLEQLLAAGIPPKEAAERLRGTLGKRHRYGPVMVTFGYILAVVGLNLRLHTDLATLLASAGLGAVVGLTLLFFRRFPRLALFSPVVAALLVSLPAFLLVQNGWPLSVASLIVPSLAAFLPGAVLTTGMIELASVDIISGTSRLVYGFSSLLFLYVGIALASQIVGMTSLAVLEYFSFTIPVWTSVLGVVLFGVGNFIRLSGRNRDLASILLVLFAATLGQAVGERLSNMYVGAFLGALALAVTAELVAMSPLRTPAFVSETLAFWFLVPGAKALLSISQMFGADYSAGTFGFDEIWVLIVAIALGSLLGRTLMTARRPGVKQ